MKFKEAWKTLPFFPLSALVFYTTVVLLIYLNIIPSPQELIPFLETLYDKFGLIGIFITLLIEGTAYVGLYFPGTSIFALSVIFASGSFVSLVKIILVATVALTICSMWNYWGGRFFRLRKNNVETQKSAEKSLFLSFFHPDLLAFYFFHRGLTKKNFWKIFYLPLLLIPYGFVLVFTLAHFSSIIKDHFIGNPVVIILAIFAWFFVSFIYKNKQDFTNGLRKIFLRK